MTDDATVSDIKSRKPLTEAQLAQRRAAAAKSREVLRAKNNKPASGMPAMGHGYGGPAKGSNWQPGYNPMIREIRCATPEERELIAQRALAGMVEIMDSQEPAAVRLQAMEKILNRIEGTPVQRVINDQQKIPLPGAVIGVRPKLVADGRQ